MKIGNFALINGDTIHNFANQFLAKQKSKMYLRKLYRSILTTNIICLFCILACDAPRENPFDPDAQNYEQPYNTKITARHLYPPNAGIADVLVLITNLNLSGVTNTSGFVEWQHGAVESLQVKIIADGYFEDQSVLKPITKENEFDILLNAIPQLDHASFISIYDNFRDQTFLNFNAEISDTDGSADITNVVLELADSQFKDILNFSSPNMYNSQFNIVDIPGSVSPGTVPELDFSLVVQNINSDSIKFESFNITRVIKQELVPLEPNSENLVIGDILFKWDEIFLNYDYTYQIILYRLAGPVELVSTFENIDSDSSQYLLDDPTILAQLSNGGYFWLLQIRDNVGNLCQSEILSFDYAKSE